MTNKNVAAGHEQLEVTLGHLLRTGVILAAAVILLGGAIYLVRHGGESPEYHVFRGEPADLRSIPGILVDAVNLKGRGIIQLGLIFLIATPVARVTLSVYTFARQHDRTYVVVTLIVLSLLAYSLFG